MRNKTLWSRQATALTVLATIIGLIAGCGSDNPAGPGVSIPQGTGTGTLSVVGEVSGSDITSGVFVTDFAVTVSDGAGLPVSGAMVEISMPTGKVLPIEDAGTPGTYRASRNGYVPGSYSLLVVRGSDSVSGIRVTAPDLHVITLPTISAPVSADQPLTVNWFRAVAAQEVTVETRDYESPAPETDDGQIIIPASDNPSRDDQRIRVFRLNRVLPAGGLPGSRWEARIRNSLEPIAVI